MGLAEFLASMEDDHERTESDGLPEAQIERLREASVLITDGNTFKPGDLVTIRKDAPMKGAGKPYLVIQIDTDADLHAGDLGNWTYATRFNVIAIFVSNGDIVPMAAPHWMLEPYAEAHS